MRRTLFLVLALALLLNAPALAEYIGGEGWWDDGYAGEWQSYDLGGLCFKLPYDWGDNFSPEEGEMLLCRDDYYVTLRVCSHPGTMWEVEDAIENSGLYWDNFQYDESANIILKDDRDWYIIANAYSMCAFTDGAYGNTTVEFSFGFEEADEYRTIVRQIISSVQEE